MSAAKAKGTRFESQVRDYVKLWKPDAERRAMQGAKDLGDIYIPGEKRFVLEIKAHRELKLAMFIEEARKEASNANVPYGVVVHKRRMATTGEAYVTMPLFAFMGLIYGDPVERGE